MKRVLILILIISNLFSAVNKSNIGSRNCFKENIVSILGKSRTVEDLNNNIAKLTLSGDNMALYSMYYVENGKNKALEIISSYLQDKFPGEFSSSDFFADALNKGPLYYKYLEPFIFIIKYLRLKALNNLLLSSGIYTDINIDELYNKYNIIFVNDDLKKDRDFLLKIGFINFKDNEGNTALMKASLYGDENRVNFLINSGANVNNQNNVGDTALMNAAMSGNKDIVTLLINNVADVNKIDKYGATALIATSLQDEHTDIADILIKSGANVNENGGPLRMTALMFASQNGYKDMVNLLITSGANVNDQSVHGKTALSLAKNEEIEQILKKHGALHPKLLR